MSDGRGIEAVIRGGERAWDLEEGIVSMTKTWELMRHLQPCHAYGSKHEKVLHDFCSVKVERVTGLRRLSRRIEYRKGDGSRASAVKGGHNPQLISIRHACPLHRSKSNCKVSGRLHIPNSVGWVCSGVPSDAGSLSQSVEPRLVFSYSGSLSTGVVFNHSHERHVLRKSHGIVSFS